VFFTPLLISDPFRPFQFIIATQLPFFIFLPKTFLQRRPSVQGPSPSRCFFSHLHVLSFILGLFLIYLAFSPTFSPAFLSLPDSSLRASRFSFSSLLCTRFWLPLRERLPPVRTCFLPSSSFPSHVHSKVIGRPYHSDDGSLPATLLRCFSHHFTPPPGFFFGSFSSRLQFLPAFAPSGFRSSRSCAFVRQNTSFPFLRFHFSSGYVPPRIVGIFFFSLTMAV